LYFFIFAYFFVFLILFLSAGILPRGRAVPADGGGAHDDGGRGQVPVPSFQNIFAKIGEKKCAIFTQATAF
jgi:hypothetical protein